MEIKIFFLHKYINPLFSYIKRYNQREIITVNLLFSLISEHLH